MDTRRLITALLAAFIGFYLWLYIAPMILPHQPQPEQEAPTATQTAPSTTPDAPATQSEQAETTAKTPVTTQPVATTTGAAGLQLIEGGTSETPIIMGNASKDSPYPMALELHPKGGSICAARIRGHYDTVEKQKPYPIIQPVIVTDSFGTEKRLCSFSTPRIRFDNLNLNYDLTDVVWHVEEQSADKTVFSVKLKDSSGRPVAKLIKTYQLPAQPPKQRTYDLGLSLEIKNLTDRPLRAVLTQRGPTGFRKEHLRGEDRAVLAAMWYEDAIEPEVNYFDRSDIGDQQKVVLGEDEDSKRIAWVAESNQYFACIMAPTGRTSAEDKASFARASAIHLSDIAEGDLQLRQDLSFQYITKPIGVKAGQSRSVAFDCYIGPKSKSAFESIEAYQERGYYATISAYFYLCAPNALVGLMMTLINTFHMIPPHNYGLAIIMLVIVVRTLLHPITKKGQVNMMKMQKQMSKLQPKINAAKEKYGNDKQQLNQAIMQIYRDEGINPAGQFMSCLPMALQIPIWAALWAALNSSIEMRHAGLDGWWIRDLAGQDALINFSGSYELPLLSMIMMGPITSFNLLPILLGVSQLLQARFMPRGNPTAQQTTGNPDQMEQQRKMMMFMSLFFVLILYNAPAGLNLYIMASNLFAIVEQWRIRQHIQEMDEKGEPLTKKKEPKKHSWLQRKWQEFEKQAEQAKRIQTQKIKQKKKSRK
jgi:YidC/Oxa1 family membrane protein insertase